MLLNKFQGVCQRMRARLQGTPVDVDYTAIVAGLYLENKPEGFNDFEKIDFFECLSNRNDKGTCSFENMANEVVNAYIHTIAEEGRTLERSNLINTARKMVLSAYEAIQGLERHEIEELYKKAAAMRSSVTAEEYDAQMEASQESSHNEAELIPAT